MPKRPKKKPAFQLHKGTGQGKVRIEGKDHYLGPYGSTESRERYDDLIAEWFIKNGDVCNHVMTVDDLCILFMKFAESYYRKNGKPTCEYTNIRVALRPLIALYGRTRAREISPLKLKAVRQKMIDSGCVRTSINRQVGRIRRMFRWAVENEYVPASTFHALSAVDGLRRGRSEAAESDPVKPVPDAMVDAVETFVSRQIWAMIRLQRLTGARPGEITIMRGCDLNTSGNIWEYNPASHKTEHHGKERVVFLGPKAKAIIQEFLKPDLAAFLFSARDAREEFLEAVRDSRKSPMTPSQRVTSLPKTVPRNVRESDQALSLERIFENEQEPTHG